MDENSILKLTEEQIDTMADNFGNSLLKNMKLAEQINDGIEAISTGMNSGIVTTPGGSVSYYQYGGLVPPSNWTPYVTYNALTDDDIKKIALEVVRLLDERDERKRLDVAIQQGNQTLGDREV